MIKVLHVEQVDKFVLVTTEHTGLANAADLRSAAINAALDAEMHFDLASERVSGKGTVTTYSWQALKTGEKA